MKKTKIIYRLMACIIFLCFLSSVSSADGWRDEFDDICSKVEIADNMSDEELQALIKRVDNLLPRVQSSDNPQKKVYIFRLKKCKNFFKYIIDMREAG